MAAFPLNAESLSESEFRSSICLSHGRHGQSVASQIFCDNSISPFKNSGKNINLMFELSNLEMLIVFAKRKRNG